jgi:hypothetical protein
MDQPTLRLLIGETELKRQIHARLSEGRLGSVAGRVSKSQRGTGRPCVICRRTNPPTSSAKGKAQACASTRMRGATYYGGRSPILAVRAPDSNEDGDESKGAASKAARPLRPKAARVAHRAYRRTLESDAMLAERVPGRWVLRRLRVTKP